MSASLTPYAIPPNNFMEGFVFLMKRDQREKRYFYKICRFLKKN
jgi:hypothetical protein